MFSLRISGSTAVPRARRGSVLPLVLATTVVIALLVGGMQFAAWRAAQVGRLAWNGQRALHAADEALARTIAEWNALEFSTTPIGGRLTRSLHTPTIDAKVTIVRTQPLGAWIEADAWSATDGTHRRARRRVGRAELVRAPALPVEGAVTALGATTIEVGASVDGRDDALIADDCGPTRDTASVAGVAAIPRATIRSVRIAGLPPERLLADSTARAQFANAWQTLTRRAVGTDVVGLGAALATAGPWAAVVLRSPVGTLLIGNWRYDGLLAIDGDLVLKGSLQLRGLLVVRGALDTRGGTLAVDGAVVVADQIRFGSVLGNLTTVRYSQCALRRALAPIAMPASWPFALWQER